MKPAIFLLLVAFATAIPDNDYYPDSLETEGDPDLEAYLKEAIENFRDQMTKGIEAIHMPVLDPLELKNLNIHVREDVAALDLVIKEANIRNLSTFDIVHLKPNLQELYLEINLTLPHVSTDGTYNMTGRVLKILPVYGGGNFSISAADLGIAGRGQLELTEIDADTKTLQMSLLKLDLGWKTIVMNLDNFLGGGSFSEVVQRIMADLGRDVFYAYKLRLMTLLEKFITAKINDKLRMPEVVEIIKMIEFPLRHKNEV